ncbi:hypothetical protein DXG01_004023, partial [Tephrocybe rancida]
MIILRPLFKADALTAVLFQYPLAQPQAPILSISTPGLQHQAQEHAVRHDDPPSRFPWVQSEAPQGRAFEPNLSISSPPVGNLGTVGDMDTSYSTKTNNPLVTSNPSVICADAPNVGVNSAVPVDAPNVSGNMGPVTNPSGSSVPATSEQGVSDIQHQHTEGL